MFIPLGSRLRRPLPLGTETAPARVLLSRRGSCPCSQAPLRCNGCGAWQDPRTW